MTNFFNAKIISVGGKCYLEHLILDSEMTMRPFFNHVKKIVHNKLFSFRKIRFYLTEYASIMFINK